MTTRFGLSISDDNGETWQTLTPYNSMLNNKVLPTNEYPTKVVANGQYIYVKLEIDTPGRQVLIMSDDYGATWHKADNFSSIEDLYISGNSIYVSGYKGLFISDDNGHHWRLSYSHVADGVQSIATKDNKKILFLTTTRNYDNYVLRSLDQGKTWEQLSLKAKTCDLLMGDARITVKTSHNIALVLKGGGACPWHLLKSIDGGNSWSKIYEINTPDLHYVGLFFDGPNIGLFDREKLYLSADEGKTWHVESNPSYYNSRIIKTDIDGQPKIIVLNECQSNKLCHTMKVSNDNGKTWTKQSIKYPAEGHIGFWSVDQEEKVLMVDQFLSRDGGVTWKLVAPPSKTLNIMNSIVTIVPHNKYLYYDYLDGSSERSNRLIYRSEDDGKTWQLLISIPDSDAYYRPLLQNNPLFVIETSSTAHDSKIPYRLFTSYDNGDSWQSLESYFEDFNFYPYTIRASKHSLYAVDNSRGSLKLYGRRFEDKESSWQVKYKSDDGDITNVVTEDDSAYAVTMPPHEANTWALGGTKLHISHDDGKTWKSTSFIEQGLCKRQDIERSYEVCRHKLLGGL